MWDRPFLSDIIFASSPFHRSSSSSSTHSHLLICGNNPQAAYCVLSRSTQSEWIHLQRTMPFICDLFSPVEASIAEAFLPALFGAAAYDPADRDLMAYPIKYGGLALPNPEKTAKDHHTNSTTCVGYLTQCLRSSADDFNIFKHEAHASASREKWRHDRSVHNMSTVTTKLWHLGMRDKHRSVAISRGMETGAWIHSLPFINLGNVLTRKEWTTGLALRYQYELKDLPRICSGCGSCNSINHAFSCHVGGLLKHAHDDVAMELILLMRRTAMKSHVRPEPAIHTRAGPHDFQSDDSKKPIATPLQSEADGRHDDEWPENKKRGDIACRHLFS